MNTVFPSVEELMPQELMAIIPASLAAEVRERYETLGGNYLTPNQTQDGRFINGMMYTSRIENCLEEIIDSVFCVLGWIFKCEHEQGSPPPDSAFVCLHGLIDIYGLLMAEKFSGTYS